MRAVTNEEKRTLAAELAGARQDVLDDLKRLSGVFGPLAVLDLHLSCPTCGGNALDAPCAYPGEHRPGCLRDQDKK